MIKIVDIYKKFARVNVFSGLSLEIQDSEVITIMGGSGAGKSVLLKNIIGLLKPDRGSIFIDDVEITSLKGSKLLEVQNKFGYLFQGAALFDSLTVGENVGFALRTRGDMSDTQIRERVSECLAMVGLKGIEEVKPAELSGGMKKRVGLARAIAHKPKYILYDEPTTGLDPIMADVINNLIIDLQKKLCITSVVVTHDMKSAFKVSDRLAMLYKGKIIGLGSPEIIKKTDDPVIHQFIEGLSQGPITDELEIVRE
jgi:phospholipid/cholesterol/gamma-HCH transport system ATP-binding protein